MDLRELEVRAYTAEPDRGRRNWTGKHGEQAPVSANRQRIDGHRGMLLLRRRGTSWSSELSRTLRDRSLAAIVGARETERAGEAAATSGGMHLSALLLLRMIGAGTSRAMRDAVAHLFPVLLRLVWTINALE